MVDIIREDLIASAINRQIAEEIVERLNDSLMPEMRKLVKFRVKDS